MLSPFLHVSLSQHNLRFNLNKLPCKFLLSPNQQDAQSNSLELSNSLTMLSVYLIGNLLLFDTGFVHKFDIAKMSSESSEVKSLADVFDEDRKKIKNIRYRIVV